ncbi:hypothetical protein [Mucilaginibacter flavidus]|uniref:hypothetical protein n=1 Tax=Mucilaginibacter flavidus TaxID=2949309 RepID=UPI0020939048|nr:hypothetical protein [Mucilaginibacter flavidus]MCO5949391.1 hypothetical protein [Mucilaginibacter flavidus]
MELFDLDELIFNLGIDPTPKQLDELYTAFERDFVNQPFTFKGLSVRIILRNSEIEGFEAYPETFVHLVTRKGQRNVRVFDRHRANRIHWISCILENFNEEEITYFEYPELDRSIREYYWYKDGDFIVIMEQITPEYRIVTSFHVDDARNRRYYEEREAWYRNNV